MLLRADAAIVAALTPGTEPDAASRHPRPDFFGGFSREIPSGPSDGGDGAHRAGTATIAGVDPLAAAAAQAPLFRTEVPQEPPRTVRCRGCGRPLRAPEARALRLGPECREWEAARRSGEIPQDSLPGL
ncbi:DUF6011 domain-containing protein [Phaeacidiphilus oryzae]|uniref:DUF6011 domain-containing protein n=1 Tax=Phaeacidiphilus oryzae TaxID=348818 RepID=UPI001F222FB1|nr:DUF6011 domain-containing protein [Phaeacidiphilus oryzae]